MSAVDLGALFVLGLVGSTHCLAMCSAFVLCLRRQSARSAWTYQGGRLLGYGAMGAMLARFGSELRAGWDANVGHAMLVTAGLTTIVLGCVQAGGFGARLATPGFPHAARASLADALRRGRATIARGLAALLSARAAAGLGLFTGLLPCPLLYAALLRASVSGSALDGASAMAAFWLGTLPALIGAATLAPLLARHGAAWWPRVALLTTLALGGLTLYHGLVHGAATHSCCDM